jgi:transcriptional regulator GlxA family with amidase domain
MSEPLSIVFALFPNVTQLDFTGPFEVLQRVPDTRISVASREGGTLRADSGLSFAGLARLSEIEACHVLCVPGGYGVTAALGDIEYLAQVRRLGQQARYLTSVCTGSLILAGAGLIQGKRAACHWAWRELLAQAGVLVQNERFVRDGNLITGGGVTAGIDFALVLAAELVGIEQAQAIQLAIEYAPSPPFSAGRPELAPPAVLQQVKARAAQQAIERKAALEAALARLPSARA